MRFSVKNPAAEAFISRFVHPRVASGSGEHDRHRRFLTVCGVASGLGLGIVPLFVAGHQAQPGLWAAVAAAAAVPFFLAVAVSRSGRLVAVLDFALVLAAVLLGTFIAISSIAAAAPLICVAALICCEPVLWRMPHPIRTAVIMAVITGVVAMFGSLAAVNIPIQTLGVGVWTSNALALLWSMVVIYAFATLMRFANAIATAHSNYRQYKEHYELLALNSGELVCMHDRDGKSVYVSPASRKVAGLDAAGFCGNGFTEKIHLQDRVGFLKAVSDVWHSKLEQKARLRLRRKGAGESAWIWIEAVLRVQLSAKGAVKSVISVSRDITAEIDNQAKRALDQEKAQKSKAAQKRFIATMSHELRTPLNAIIGFADVLEQELFGKLEHERHRDYVSHIHASGQHLLHVVNDLLDMSRLDADRYELEFSEFSLTDVVDATLVMMAPLASKASVNILRETNDNLPVMRGDRRSWQQILINLISNAIKFTPEGGAVRLTTRQFGRNVKIVVRDTGIGIDAGFLKSIGQPFMQAESGPDRRFEGSGLGLSVVKGLVDLHGGDFEISSVPGKGTTATAILPMQPASARSVPHTEEIRVVGLLENQAADEAHPKPSSSVASKGDSHARLSA